ncbi:SDR family oxidoreductase [Anaerobacillus alkaliphilus]|uniref:SDR family oxidoreductase n=1 Tax=Anaerobacillus alkaliphilus TaxID=1548597 RepID=A0A4Q0VP24_9BACI|nr:SDR family oxidoreductase [Anaerobacillus alkaliphilus]RXI97948.1 SDR family oxidoreductase [Anaerobacillus alkaliphilus]
MKYALITGASGGIGREIATALAKEGYGLYLHYHKNEDSIDQLREEFGHSTTWKIQADLSHKSGVADIVNQVLHPIDVLILNSGASFFGLLTDMTDSKVDEMIQLHLTSPLLLTKAFLPTMIQKKTGKIAVISSIWGVTGASCEVLYSTVKGGLNTFVKALAKEVAPSGINVNGVAPGAITTSMMSQFDKDEIASLCEDIPMGRLGKPEEVADLVTFLISEKASYINGQIININGAWYC